MTLTKRQVSLRLTILGSEICGTVARLKRTRETEVVAIGARPIASGVGRSINYDKFLTGKEWVVPCS